MKLIIQIPCFNEVKMLPEVIRDLPRMIESIDAIEFLVIDDGSTDGTAEKARELGVHHVLSLGTNRGLAQAFLHGIRYATEQGADIVVNTDGDNQYAGGDIPKLVEPILKNRADMVIGCRPIVRHPEFGAVKKFMQLAGSWALRRLSGLSVEDAASGFRAFSRQACFKFNLYTSFSHCAESLIQAGHLGLRVASAPVRVNPKTRDSRLFRSIPQYICRQGATMLMMFVLYRPGAFFFSIGSVWLAVAVGLGLRFLYLVYGGPAHVSAGRTHIPSLIFLAVCATQGFLLWALGIVGELIRFHRRVAEENLLLAREDHARK
ncbi:MAG: glycosyltransferase family 2 protein [Verrucomicrobiota bacterium]|nr:glycosyltransferase family 2 protein [Verrucomicrobiota bacterium]